MTAARPLFVLCTLALVSTSVLARDSDPRVLALGQRLKALQADPQTADVARYERLEAQQAIDALADAKRRDQDNAAYLADRRVEIAETAARTAVARRQVDQLEATRSDLLIEASRREAARARQEAERLRMQAQMQAEEAERLRQTAEQETLARQDAEQALSSVAGKQTAKLNAAQQKAIKLAHEEAELMAGGKLPASKVDSRGEVFTLGSAAFAKGGADLASADDSSMKALVEYLQLGKKGRVRVIGYDKNAGLAGKRADSVRDALVAGGVSASRLQSSAGKGAASASKAVEVVVLP